MKENTDGKKPEKVGGRLKQQRLVAILGVLVGIIVVLAIGIGIFYGQNKGDYEITEDDSSEMTAKEKYIKSLVDADESYQISLRISNVYNDDGDKEGALGMYEEELTKALEAQNYSLFLELTATRSTMLDLDGRCDEAVALYDTIDYAALPDDIKVAVYSDAAVESANCENMERANYWSEKANEL